MLINSSLGFMEVSGRQNLDMSMANFVRVPLRLVTQVAWRKLFGGKSKAETDPDQIDEIDIIGDRDKVRYLHIRITCPPTTIKRGWAGIRSRSSGSQPYSTNTASIFSALVP